MRSLKARVLARIGALMRRGDLERGLALALTICAIVAGVATYAFTSWAPLGETGVRTLLVLLNVDLILLLLLGIVIARRLVRLVLERRRGSAGSRLHVRLVALFGLLAATPAIVVAIFSVVFLSSGLEYWFSARVSSALENSLSVAEAYLEEHREVIRADALAMAADLEREGPGLFASADHLRHFVVGQAALRSLTEVIVFDSQGIVLAHSGLGIALELEQLPGDLLTRAERGEVVTLTSAAEDRIRAVLRLNGVGDAFLFVGRFVDPQVLGYMERTQKIVTEYRQLQTERTGIQVTSALIFGIVALLLLLAAVWVGINLADRLARPIARLITAAERVGTGDLAARVPESAGADELAMLSRAFNRMTDQLDSQRRELIATNEQLDARRRFTEAVLAGVTAGVIGLDAERRIVLPNRLAADMLAPTQAQLLGQPIEAAFPELAGLFERLTRHPEEIVQEELDLDRGHGKRILLVRLAAQLGPDRILGYVVTFDDVTELVSAQRQAAWSEVARRIAHEIKNPLTPIRLSAERLNRRFLQQIAPEDQETFGRAISTIIKQVDAIGRLVGEFSAFARMPQPRIRFEPLGEILRGAVTLQQVASPMIDIRLAMPPGDPLVIPCDAEKVEQAMTNLLQNAVNAIVESADTRPSRARPQIEVTAERTDGGVHIEVADDGPGFPPLTRERLFEPYFTTRTQGTGLGLAIVKKIMEEHRGRVDLDNGTDGGAVARLWFPVGSGDPMTAAPRGVAGAGADGKRAAERSVVGAG